MAKDAEQLSLGALNRALLARQGLLERLDAPLVEAVEAIGALQAQHWPAPPVALWSRVKGFAPPDLYAALERGDLVTGTLLRTTTRVVCTDRRSRRAFRCYWLLIRAGSGLVRRDVLRSTARAATRQTREENR